MHRPFIETIVVCALLFSPPALIGADEKSRPIDPQRREKLRKFLEDRLKKGGDGAVDADLKRQTWKVGDVERSALVYAPPKTEKKPPLVMVFHGHGGRSEYSVRKMAVHKLWPEAVCVYPLGLPTPVPKFDPEGKHSGWQKYAGDQGDRDFAFFDAMVQSMKSDHSIDEKRVYCMGHSNGGFFTYLLVAARPDAVAAGASIAGNMNIRDTPEKNPKPFFHVAGQNDPLIPFSSQERSIDRLLAINGCDPAAGKPAGELCTEYPSKHNAPVVTYIHPGAHEVPQDAIPRIVQFFKDH